MDHGTSSSQQNCVNCCQSKCSVGSTNFFNYIQACICNGGPCTTQCGGSGDYCQTVGSVTTTKCNNCLVTAMTPGGTCDTQVTAACNADPDCAAYDTCSGTTGCP